MSMRLTGQARKADRLLVVPGHHDGQPPVLMMLSPDVGAHESRLVSDEMDLPFRGLMIGLEEVADPGEDTPESVTLRQVLRGGPMALIEVFAIAQPEIVLTRRPRMIPLCAPSPHIPVKSGEKVSTAGILCRDADGDLGVTACYHGTGPVGTEVAVGLRKCRVKRADVVQDIVFIALGQGFNVPQIAGLNGVRADREPARSDRARFDGVSNQNTNTRIFGADAGLLRSRPTIMLKVQTDPDTDQGDSGSALLDENDKVLGFAFERTAYDDYPQFTDWIAERTLRRGRPLQPHHF
jgi:hypothetical protein